MSAIDGRATPTYMPGYSQKRLIDKFGTKPGMKAALKNVPRGLVSDLKFPASVAVAEHGRNFDVVIYFSNSFGKLRAKMGTLRRMIKKNGAIWICWPKAQRRSGRSSLRLLGDFTENDIRRLALSFHLVDVKVIAVDETWSGLKLVIPVALRGLKEDEGIQIGKKRIVV